jgi:hypothetical protein
MSAAVSASSMSPTSKPIQVEMSASEATGGDVESTM